MFADTWTDLITFDFYFIFSFVSDKGLVSRVDISEV